MARMIDADIALEIVSEQGMAHPNAYHLTNYATLILRGAPTVDAVEVVHGRWDDSGRYTFPNGNTAVRCSICGCALAESEYKLYDWNYCPICGARMDASE